MKEAAKLSNVTCDRLDDDRAVLLNHKAQAITGVDAEMLPHFLRDGDLAFGGQGRCWHTPPYNSKYPYICVRTMSPCRVRRELPYDFDELIATIAPRPVLVVEPTMDRATTPADVRQAVARARQVYNLYFASDKLTLHEPVEYTRLTGARAGTGRYAG